VGEVGGGGEEVGGHVASQQLTVPVVDDTFVERLGHTLGDGAVELAIDDHRVDHRTAVVHGNITDELDRTGLCVDLDVGEVRAKREDGIRWLEAVPHSELNLSVRIWW